MEKLTIQQLYIYLPYKLYGTVHYEMNLSYDTEVETLGDECITFKSAPDVFWDDEYNTFKPHLYPIDYLTKPIQHEGREFIPLLELAKISFPRNNWELGNYYNSICAISEDLVFGFTEGSFYANDKTQRDVDNQLLLFQKLSEWHINYLGIPNELFINKETLK